jgi:uncharacterized protein (TIRG00374 family)
MNKERGLRFLKIIFSFIFMICILYYFFGKNPESLKRDLLKVDYFYVLLSMVFGALAYINRGLRWIILIDALGHTISRVNAISAVSVGYFTNLFIPRAGEISRCTSLKNSDNIPVDKLFGTILIERVIDLFFLLVGVILAIFLKSREITYSINEYRKLTPKEESASWSNSIIITVFDEPVYGHYLIKLGCIVILSLLIYFFKKNSKKIPLYKRKFLDFIDGLKLGFKSIKKIKNKASFWFHTLSIWIMYFLMTYICLYAIPETSHLGVSDALFLLVIGGIGMVIPTPGGFGSYHVIVMVGLVALNIDKGFISVLTYNEYNPAILNPIIVHTGQTFVAIIMGSIGLFMLFINKKILND